MMGRPGCRIIFMDGVQIELVENYKGILDAWFGVMQDTEHVPIIHGTDFNTHKQIAIKADTISRIVEAGY